MKAVAASNLLDSLNVSRETFRKLEAYAALLEKWNKTHNLVGQKTVSVLWDRHILDCAQLAAYLPDKAVTLLDIGSGAGLPGLILAVLGYQDVHLVEANHKKGAFLSEAKRQLGVSATLHIDRLEQVPPFKCDIITARAVADLSELLEMSVPFSSESTEYIYLKGESAQEEIQRAEKKWMFHVKQSESYTSSTSHILCLKDVKKCIR